MTYTEILLPPSDGAPFTVSVVLDGIRYVLDFRYNVRAKYWTIDLMNGSREPIYTGIRGVADYDLLTHCPHPERPSGRLYLVDLTGRGIDPLDHELGERVRLVYVSG